MKYIIDKDGNITGRSFCEEIAGIETPHKPLREGESCRWNGSKWEYQFRDYPEKDVSEIPENTQLYYSTKFILDELIGCLYLPTGTCIYGDEYKYKEGQKLTVLIPCYGKAKYIKDTVSSVLANTLLPDKIIILLMDEDSIALKDELSAMSGIIDCREHERLCVEKARNYLATLADSEWLMFLDADDQLYPDYFEVLLKGEEPNKVNAAIRHTRMHNIDLKGNSSLDADFNKTFIKFGSRIYGTGSFICHSDVMKDYQFNPDCNMAGEDTTFFVDVACDAKYSFYFHSEIKFKYFMNTDNSLSQRFYASENWRNTVKKYIFPKLYKYIYKLPANKIIKIIDTILQDIIQDSNYETSYIYMLNNCLTGDTIKTAINNNIYNLITSMFKESRERKPLETYSKDKFTIIGEVPEGLDLEGTEFDVLMFNDISETSPCDIFERQGNLIINNKILDEVMLLDKTWLERLVYMLDKYCVLTLGNNPETEDMFLYEKKSNFITTSIQKVFNDRLPANIKEIIQYINKPINTIHISTPVQYITFALNRTCNKNCAYCNEQKADNIDEETLFKNFDRYLTKAEEAYGDKLFPQLLGGEPTLLSYETQVKIIKRLEKYPMVKIFTNGYDKESPMYTYPNFVKNVHATVLEQIPDLISELDFPDVVVYVATKKQLPEIEQWLEEHKALKLNNLQVIPCLNTGNESFDIDEENIIKLAQLRKKYNLCHWFTPELTETIIQGRFDIARNQCHKKQCLIQIDCITGKVLPCCSYSASSKIDINNFDFSSPNKYLDTEACEKCLTFGNYVE